MSKSIPVPSHTTTWIQRRSSKDFKSYLDFNVADFRRGADDRPANQRWENVFGEVGSREAALDKLGCERKEKTGKTCVNIFSMTQYRHNSRVSPRPPPPPSPAFLSILEVLSKKNNL